jgi:hypothetical protein
MSDTKNRTMKAVESMGLQAASQPSPADPGGLELRQRDHPMLSCGNSCDFGVSAVLGEF